MSRRAGPGSTAKDGRAATAGRGATATSSNAARTGSPTRSGTASRNSNPTRSGNATTATKASTDRAAREQEQPASPATIAAEVAAAVLAVPGVTRLTPGAGVEVATQFPGGKVTGIRLGDPVEVHVEVDPVPIAPVAEQIRNAVREVLGRFGRGSSVEVVVEDIDLPVPATATAGS
ncbi:hypothetical protein ACFP2T_06140 [Plantactinospora solaniradicis]|uniref:Asp23/Gls24 family envelope stress response protein n=1 Tax=Plantactinospora solaniradicis TaxID=1723736 RepID=A0ABW1K1Z7_9ACTN